MELHEVYLSPAYTKFMKFIKLCVDNGQREQFQWWCDAMHEYFIYRQKLDLRQWAEPFIMFVPTEGALVDMRSELLDKLQLPSYRWKLLRYTEGLCMLMVNQEGVHRGIPIFAISDWRGGGWYSLDDLNKIALGE